jgi:hypothetical protein
VRIVLVGCQLILSLVLLIAAAGKLTYPQQFITAIRVSGVSRTYAFPVAILTVILELELASSLVFSSSAWLPVAFVGTFLLLGGFTIWLASVYRRKLQVQCGCFGASHVHINKGSILRNLLFMGVSVIGFFVTFSTPGILPSSSNWIFAIDAILAVGTLLIFLKHLSQEHGTHSVSHIASGTQGEVR